MKKIDGLKLFLLGVVFLLGSQLYAQNTFVLSYTATTLDRGNSTGIPMNLKISNTSGNLINGTYTVNMAFSGLYVNSLSATSASSYITITPNAANNSFTILIAGATSNTADITFNLWAGQCFDVDPSRIISNILSITQNSTTVPVVDNQSLTIYKRSYMIYTDNGSIRTATVGSSRQATFEYYFLNSSGYTLNNGFISFNESNLGAAYYIRQVEFLIIHANNSVEPLVTFTNPAPISNIPDQNDNTFITNLSSPLLVPNFTLNNGDKLKAIEYVQLNGCFENNSSTPLFKWGYSASDLCDHPAITLSTNVFGQISPLITIDNTQGISNFYCYGSTYNQIGGEDRFVKIKNEGNDVARSVNLNLKANDYSNIMIKYTNPSDVYVLIRKQNGTFNTFSPDVSEYSLTYNSTYSAGSAPSFIPGYALSSPTNGYVLYYNGQLHAGNNPPYKINAIMSAKEMNENVFPNRAINFSLDCIGDENTLLLYDLFIDHIMINGVSSEIILEPGDELELHWKEYNCCFIQTEIKPGVNGAAVYGTYRKVCGATPVVFDPMKIEANRMNLSFRSAPSPAAATTSGEVDLCTQTSDGKVERISTHITEGSGMGVPFSGAYLDNGRVVFRIFLQNGFDLDRALTWPHSYGWTTHDGLYNFTDASSFVTNTVPCNSTCSNCSTSTTVSAAQQYYVAIRPKIGGVISPSSIRLVEKDNNIQPDQVHMSNVLFTPKELLFMEDDMYANFMYEVSFNIADLENYARSNGLSMSIDHIANITTILSDSYFDFDIRAYCSNKNKPEYKVVMYVDRCSGTDTKFEMTGCDGLNSRLTSMVPVFSFSNNMMINCPGCQIPGGNISDATLDRINRDLKDADNNHIPDDATTTLSNGHSTLKVATNGDRFLCSFSEAMSDGNTSPSIGISHTQLIGIGPAYELDNLYIQVSTDAPSASSADGIKFQGSNKNFELTSLKVNGVPVTISKVLINNVRDNNS